MNSTMNCGVEMNHAVTIVGYAANGVETPYWIVQNSWGEAWGSQGYFYVQITDGEGVCGINQMPSYPNLNLKPDPLLFWSIIGCMTFPLFVVLPCAWFRLK